MTARPIVLILFAALILVGCASAFGTRPIDTIRQRADFEFQRGNYDVAAQEYGEIAARYPGDWRAQHRFGVALMETGDYNESRRALDVAHSLRPGDADIADDLAEVMFRQGDEQQLFDFLNERALATQSVRAYRRLASYAMEVGDPDAARGAINRAIALDGGSTVEPYIDAADLAERVGDLDQAVHRLRQALSIDPHDDRVRERLRTLGEVPGPSLALPPGR
jgi:tetratricopeptide (TPR) repeat protein